MFISFLLYIIFAYKSSVISTFGAKATYMSGSHDHNSHTRGINGHDITRTFSLLPQVSGSPFTCHKDNSHQQETQQYHHCEDQTLKYKSHDDSSVGGNSHARYADGNSIMSLPIGSSNLDPSMKNNIPVPTNTNTKSLTSEL